MSTGEPCVFCRILRRELPACVLTEDERLIVFLSKENHPLVVPKAHVPDIYTLDDVTAAAILPMAKRVANTLKAALACDGIYLTQANEAAAGQDVFHFHLHVYPRWVGTPLSAQQKGVAEAARAEMLARLQSAWPIHSP